MTLLDTREDVTKLNMDRTKQTRRRTSIARKHRRVRKTKIKYALYDALL